MVGLGVPRVLLEPRNGLGFRGPAEERRETSRFDRSSETRGSFRSREPSERYPRSREERAVRHFEVAGASSAPARPRMNKVEKKDGLPADRGW